MLIFNYKGKHAIIFLLFAFYGIEGFAQPQRSPLIDLKVYPASGSYDVSVGEQIDFEVVVYQYSKPVQEGEVTYKHGPEKFEGERRPLKLRKGKALIKGEEMDVPGFYRCFVYYELNGKEYRHSSTVAVSKERIKPTTEMPADFQAFWQRNLESVEGIPLEPTMTLLPEKCTDKANFYHISYKVGAKSRFFGVLTIPKKVGKYPAKLSVPGAGVRAYHGGSFELDKVITLQVGIHGIPVNLYHSSIYEDLGRGALSGYAWYRLDDKDQYYYKRVILGCVRAVDFIHALPEFDGETLAISGGSQGGALSIITASLDERIDYLISYFPALSDHAGYLKGRAGGWPHFFVNEENRDPQKIETASYYDVVNFARSLKIPGFYSYGYNDNVCPPTSVLSVLNVIEAEKEIVISYDVGHWNYPEVWQVTDDWLSGNFFD